MRKILISTLTLACALGLAACGSDSPDMAGNVREAVSAALGDGGLTDAQWALWDQIAWDACSNGPSDTAFDRIAREAAPD